jgi:hypothetical protein
MTGKLDPNELANILVGQAMEMSLSDDLWRLRGFGLGRPRRGALFRRFIEAERLSREQSFLREIMCAAIGAQFLVVERADLNGLVIALLARILQLATAGADGSDNVAKSLRFEDQTAALHWVAEALVEYRRVDTLNKIVEVWRDRVLRNAPSIGSLEADASFEGEFAERLNRAVETIDLLVRAGISQEKISVYDHRYVEVATSIVILENPEPPVS